MTKLNIKLNQDSSNSAVELAMNATLNHYNYMLAKTGEPPYVLKQLDKEELKKAENNIADKPTNVNSDPEEPKQGKGKAKVTPKDVIKALRKEGFEEKQGDEGEPLFIIDGLIWSPSGIADKINHWPLSVKPIINRVFNVIYTVPRFLHGSESDMVHPLTTKEGFEEITNGVKRTVSKTDTLNFIKGEVVKALKEMGFDRPNCQNPDAYSNGAKNLCSLKIAQYMADNPKRELASITARKLIEEELNMGQGSSLFKL